MNPGSQRVWPVRWHRGLDELEGHADAGEVLVGVCAIGTFGVDDRERRRQRGVRLVMIGDDEIEPKLARPGGRGRTPDTAVDRDDDADLLSRESLDTGWLEPVPIRDPVRNEMHDVSAEQLQHSPEDHRRCHAVDIVVAVHGDTFLAVNGAQQPVDRQREIRELEGVVQVVERGLEEALRIVGRRDPSERQ